MYCLDYELTECGVKLCCYDCNNKQCNKKCELEKIYAIACVQQNQVQLMSNTQKTKTCV